jgi:arginine deiminase
MVNCTVSAGNVNFCPHWDDITLVFVSGSIFMMPEGAVLARPASTVRAVEKRWVARRLFELGVPILKSVQGRGTLEGDDAAWSDPSIVMPGGGLRTNAEGASQVSVLLLEMNVREKSPYQGFSPN